MVTWDIPMNKLWVNWDGDGEERREMTLAGLTSTCLNDLRLRWSPPSQVTACYRDSSLMSVTVWLLLWVVQSTAIVTA